jgi:hypothetical protein
MMRSDESVERHASINHVISTNGRDPWNGFFTGEVAGKSKPLEIPPYGRNDTGRRRPSRNAQFSFSVLLLIT